MTTVTTVPFSKLAAVDAINARHGGGKDGLDELAASIEVKGLIQPLAVRPADGGSGRYEIIDGRRRWQAIARLVKDKVLKRDHPVPVLVRDEDDAEALESSLMANVVRLPMHPVDQHEVMARLAAGGHSAHEIAARFGLAERTVRQHLALGRLAPEVRKAWRDEVIDAETAQAFAVHPDPAVQAAALEKLRKGAGYGMGVRDWEVRQELRQGRERADQSDELALVGEDAYRAAGGRLDDDLFSDHRYIADVPLLKKLARDLMLAKCRELIAAGWAWAEVEERGLSSYDCEHVLGRDAPETGEDHDFTPEQMARSGCLVSIGTDYDDNADKYVAGLNVSTGLIKPAGAERQTDLEDAIGDDDEPGELPSGGAMVKGDGPGDPFEVSEALRITIHEAMTVASAAVVRTHPIVALQAIVAQLMCSSGSGPVKLIDTGNAVVSDRHKRDYQKRFDLWLELMSSASTDELLGRLAQRTAQALSMVPSGEKVFNATTDAGEVYALRDFLPAADYLTEMRRAFPVADYFARASKATAIAALEEMHDGGHRFGLQGRSDLEGMKKPALAEWAAEQAKACGWLPPQLRHKAYELVLPEAKEPRAARGKMAAAGDVEAGPAKKRRRA